MSLAAPSKSRSRRRGRAVFLWGCALLLLAVLLIVGAGAWLHLVGLPNFLKQRLLSHLRDRGFEAQFTSARLNWGPEVAVQNAAFRRSGDPMAPRISAGRTVIRLDPGKLLRGRNSVDALQISQGSLELPFSEAPDDCLSLTNVSFDLVFITNNTLQLEHGQAGFHGIQIGLRGALTNYTAAREWSLWQAAGASPQQARDSLRRIATNLDQVHFQAPPSLELHLTADARDPSNTLRADLTLACDGIQTPWGDVSNLKLAADCAASVNSGSSPLVNAHFSAATLTTPQASGRNLSLTAGFSRAAGSNLQASLNFAVANFSGRLPGSGETNGVEAASLRWNGNVTFHPSPLALVAASGSWRIGRSKTPWGSADSAVLTLGAATVEGAPAPDLSWPFLSKINHWSVDCQATRAETPWGSADSASMKFSAAAAEGFPGAGDSWGFWTNFNRWAVDWQASLIKLITPEVQFDQFACAGSWRAPELVLTNLDAPLYGGGLSGSARLDVASRELKAGARFDFDPRRLAHFLPAAAQARLGEFFWEHPPRAAFEGRMVLPVWSRWPSDWAAQLLPSLQVTGDFSVGPSSFRGIALDSAQSRFSYSNRVLDLPRLHLVRPEGEAWVDFTANDDTGAFAAIIDSHLDPADFRPLLPDGQQPLLDKVVFSKAEPPDIHAEIRGRWDEPTTLAGNARVAATNFTALGENVAGVQAVVEYTNSLTRLTDLRLLKDGGELDAPLVEIDLKTGKFTLSNAVSTLDPHLVIRLLGPKTPAWFRAIGFDTPPTIRVGGSFVLDDAMATDLHFDISGRNFRYSRLLAETASGQVLWTAKTTTLTNVQADLYVGSLKGWCVFDDKPQVGTLFHGGVTVAGIELPLVVRGWSTTTNNVQGVLNGSMTLTDGNTANIKTWNSYGALSVSNALLWDFRLFGIFSPILNALIPGFGNLRAYQGSMDFVTTNGMVATGNLEIRCTDFRLLYRGTLNTEKQLDAKVKAELLRDTPLVGRIISFFTSPLTTLVEYKIGGTLDEPTREPLFVHKALSVILEPFHKKPPPPADSSTPPSSPSP
jgi:hypothetical protein